MFMMRMTDDNDCGDQNLNEDDYHCDDNDHEEDNPILERGRTDRGLRCLLKLIQITCGLFCFQAAQHHHDHDDGDYDGEDNHGDYDGEEGIDDGDDDEDEDSDGDDGGDRIWTRKKWH